MASASPRLWVIAGPNGAGKSSLVTVRIGRRLPIVNPDDIARDLGGGPGVIAAAGRQAIQDRGDFLNSRKSFGIETTLSGAGALAFMATCVAAGYRLMFIYVGVDDPVLSRARVIERVARGGHDVPASDVMRRYPDSMANLPRALAMAERAWVVDNSGLRRRLLLSLDRGRTRYRAAELPEWATKAVNKTPP
jgi:predicted ABC-type ATPase